MGSAPYFVLGAAPTEPLRLRIATPWDWRLDYRLQRFDCSPLSGGQPKVGWEHPLAQGRVNVEEAPGKPGMIRVALFIMPAYQLDELPLPLRAVFDVPARDP